MTHILRAKMSVESVKHVCGYLGEKSAEEIALRAVHGPEGSANRQWSESTPNGMLTLTVRNPGAFDKVLPGQFFFVDLTVTEKDAT